MTTPEIPDKEPETLRETLIAGCILAESDAEIDDAWEAMRGYIIRLEARYTEARDSRNALIRRLGESALPSRTSERVPRGITEMTEKSEDLGVDQEGSTARTEAPAPIPLEPADAFGLLRSYSRHLMFVRLALSRVSGELQERATIHDASKMLDDEFAGFSRINAAARINKFGSPEYKDGMKREKPTIDLHFSRNTHHAEYYADHPEALMNGRGAEGMTFLDIIEMVCDWWGAGKGYDDPRPWEDSVALNFAQKGKYLSPEQMWLAKEVAGFLGKKANDR